MGNIEMSDIINTGHAGLWGLINDKNSGIDLPKPFEHDIFLLHTHIAGTSYIEDIMELEPFINAGDRLEMFREPDNEYDELAIVVKNADGVKLGYIPRAQNAVLARLMDAGKLLFCRVSGKELVNERWLKISIKIYMRD